MQFVFATEGGSKVLGDTLRNVPIAERDARAANAQLLSTHRSWGLAVQICDMKLEPKDTHKTIDISTCTTNSFHHKVPAPTSAMASALLTL